MALENYIHKVSINVTIEELPIKTVVSNIGTAKYLAKNLSPLGQSTYLYH